jgi:hypothetical protein
MSHIVKIRYNTLCDDDNLYWRILIDSEEFTCSDIIINCKSYTTKDEVFDKIRNQFVTKHHITCFADYITWTGDKVILN